MNSYFRAIISLVFSCLFIFTASGQRNRLNNPRFVPIPEEQPLVIIDSFITDISHLLLSSHSIESMDILKDSNVTAAYGQQAKYGVIIIRTKKNTEIVKINQLFTQFNIPEPDRNLNVSINNILVKDIHKLIVDKNDIVSVEVVKDNIQVTPEVYGSGERHINIVTKSSR